jgi:hypothetical protein
MQAQFRAARSMVSARTIAVLLTLLVATVGLVSSGTPSRAMQALGPVAVATPVLVDGNIGAHTIEIDSNANLYPEATPNAGVLNAPADVDWVKDSADNQGTGCLNGSIATCNEANITAAAGGVGHWNGARIVDGIPGTEQDIFLTGGKENDVSTWNVGPGSVGSSKYDITQAYLANNHSAVFFGMERRGNNGTTAFDFEFNQAAPASIYTPTRTIGDRLFTFEMQGSGGSGSAVPHYFTWNGTAYVEQTPLPAGLISSINNTATPAGPWGFVDSHGNWTPGSLDRFEFAEAVAPLSLFNLTGCGGALFVQVRTRSSATAGSDLKDATKIFQYQFGGPVAAAALSAGCSQFTYDGAGSTDSQGGSNITYSWVFTAPVGVTLSGGGVTGGSGGIYHSTLASGTVTVSGISGAGPALIAAQNTVTENGTTCSTSSAPASVNVYPAVAGTASITPSCGPSFDYTAAGSGGNGSYTYQWSFQKNSLDDGTGTWSEVGTSTTASGTFSTATTGEGKYRAIVTITDGQGLGCFVSLTPGPIDVRNVLTATASKTSANASAATLTGSSAAGASLQWQRLDGATWVNISGATSSTLVYSGFETDASPSAITFTIGSDSYNGNQWSVQLRLHASRTLNGLNCTADSPAVTVKKVTAVDP